MRRRPAAACFFLLLLAPAAGGLLGAIDETVGDAFLVKARAAYARGNRRAVERLVADDRWVAFEAFYGTLADDSLGPGSLSDLLASAYAGSFADRSLQDALARARAWTPAQRARRREAFEMRKAGRASAREGRLDEAAGTFARALEVYRDLGDLREEAWSLSSLGAIAAMRGESREALAHLERAAEAARQVGDLSLLGAVAMNRAYALDDLGDTKSALSRYDEALALSRQTSDLQSEMRGLASRGTLFTKTGRLDEAAADFFAAVAAGERSGDLEVQAVAWLNLASIDQLRADTQSQVRHLRRSADVARRGGFPLTETDASLALAQVARKRGDFDEARRRLLSCREALAASDDVQRLHVLDLEEAKMRIDRGRYGEALNVLAAAERRLEGLVLGGRRAQIFQTRAVALYYLGDYEGAVGQLRASVEDASKGNEPELEGGARAQLGYVLFTLGDGKGGLAELEEAVRIEEKIGNRPGRGSHLDAIGFIKYRTGDLAGARRALEEALATLPSDGNVGDRAEATKDLALVLLATGGEERRRGFDMLRQARETFARLDDFQGVFHASLLEADAALADADAAAARAALARAESVPIGRSALEDAWLLQHLRGRLADLEGDTAEARRRYQRAVTEVENLRGAVRPALWRAALMEDRIAPYRALVRLLRDQGEIDAAWRVARSAKARTFVESLVVPDFDATPTTANQATPEVLPASWRPNPDRARNLRALLREDERLIDFFPDGREVTAFILSRDGLAARTLRRDEAGESLAARWPGRPEAGDAAVTTAWRRAMARIGSALFEPLMADLAGAKHLIIVPGGALHGVPFAAVEVGGKRIVDRFQLSVLPAADALLSRGRRATGSGALVMGDPASGQPRLPAAAREANAVGTLLGGAKTLTGAAATEAAFRVLAPGKDQIHLAAHGRIDRIAPTRTHLALAAGGGDRAAGGGNDGRLEAGEVAVMDLAASLVVLSGCGTGIDGGMARGDAPADERAGLPRAFLQAGAGTVVASLWEMDDAASAAILPHLYTALRSLPPDAALASLQRDLAAGRIRGEDGAPLDHPYYWAGLLTWGAGFAPPLTSTSGK